MPRQDPRTPGHGQAHLFDPPTTKDSQRLDGGRHSRAMAGALSAARDAGLIDRIDDGLATVLLAGAWELDSHEAQNQPYGPSKVIPAMVEGLREARMTPDSRQTQTEDKIAALIDDLAAADAADPAPAEDRAELRCFGGDDE
ncbi:hypothetical protein CHEID_10580 (plasmid) [Corynebacterium heidelbergense]|uniref:hypothetical protein n=1 Tax=Corynebacterium heidelbergense TaxID=2055947 RepID=UPI002358304B|nr:hypothetical protein [Corynebacterium heidelbergense]WCZ36178.1 hypothetical protein CHEID_03090 [Corynebacterium heidelbergense]WCZ37633.1 hypothetical protein CHEID_10580 [Corynebacterium heidelbergense]